MLHTEIAIQAIADKLNARWDSYEDGYARHEAGYNFYEHAMELGRAHGVEVDDDRHDRSGVDVTDEIYFVGGWSLVLSGGEWVPVESDLEPRAAADWFIWLPNDQLVSEVMAAKSLDDYIQSQIDDAKMNQRQRLDWDNVEEYVTGVLSRWEELAL